MEFTNADATLWSSDRKIKMNESRKIFGGISVIIPDDWHDVTASLQNNEAPFSLAKETIGKGALQFSPALYERGKIPQITTRQLTELLYEFAAKKILGEISGLVITEGEIKTVGGSFIHENDFLRVWYCSDGKNIVLATYICCLEDVGGELNEGEKIVRSLRFELFK